MLGWITGIIFLLIEKDSYVCFHAVQSIITFGGLEIIIILWIVLMMKAYQGECFKLPIVGDIAEKYAG